MSYSNNLSSSLLPLESVALTFLLTEVRVEWKGDISIVFSSVKFSEYKEIELLVVRVTRNLGFRLRVPAREEEFPSALEE